MSDLRTGKPAWKNQKGKFNKGQKGGSGHDGVGKGNFDEIMKGFIIFTDRDREKNCVTDANNFLLPMIEEMFPNVYHENERSTITQKKIKTEDHENKETETIQIIPEGQQEEAQTGLEGQAAEKEEQVDQKIVEVEGNEEKNDSKNENGQGDQQNEDKKEDEQQNDKQNEQEDKSIEEKQEKGGEQETEGVHASRRECAESTTDRLEEELNNLKNQKDKLLYNVNTDVKCAVFLKINSRFSDNIDVTAVVEAVMNKVHVERTPLTRFCHRIFPAEYAFKANEENFKKYLKLVIDERVPTDAPCSWMLECKSRNNNKFNRKSVLDIVQGLIPSMHFVDYKNPFITIVVDVCHNLMCLSVLKNYYEYKKYSAKVNPELNNYKDSTVIPIQQVNRQNHNHNKKELPPVTEEEKIRLEEQQELIKAQLRAEHIVAPQDDDEDIDLI